MGDCSFHLAASDEFWKMDESSGFRCEAENFGSWAGSSLVGWGVGVEVNGKF